MENDDQLNTYSWSCPPGLREKADGIVQAIRGASTSFERTASSSSITSTTTAKRRKFIQKNLNNVGETTVLNDTVTAKSPSRVVMPLNETGNSTARELVPSQAKNSNNNPASMSTSVVSNTEPNATTPKGDIDSLLKENQALREKILALEDDLLNIRETTLRKSYIFFALFFQIIFS